MQLLLKIAISVAVLLAATGIAKRYPSLAGLIGVMPVAGAMVLAWVYVENSGEPRIMHNYALGALWGIVPSILFYLAAYYCLKRGMGLGPVFAVSFTAWGVGALIHHLFLK